VRILFLSQYFPPEIGASQIRAFEMAQGLVNAGHAVTMIAEVPNHPTGVIQSGFRRKLFVRGDYQGIDTIWVWVRTSQVKTFRSRLILYMSYLITSVLAGLFLTRGKYDAIYATSPPLLVGTAGLIIAQVRNLPFFFEVQDLWPEAAITIGQLRNPRYIRWATWLEESCYSRARTIIVTAQEMIERLSERGIPSEKLSLIRNGSNIDLFRPNPESRNRIREELGLEGKFLAVYAGLHGLVYDLVHLMDVAASLQQDERFHFLLVGEGPTKVATIQRSKELELTNVTFLPQQPREKIPDYFNAADVTLAPLREPEVMGGFPVKVYDSMACAVPVIVNSRGETRRIVTECESGVAVDPGDYCALKSALLTLSEDDALRSKMGHNGRKAVVARFSRQAQARQLADLLKTELDRHN
jgi:colanic acid biosynthesis glycosyl transferase WcaI